MGLNKQFAKIKENWLLIVLILLLVFFSNSFIPQGIGINSLTQKMAFEESYGVAMDSSRAIYPSPGYGDFAPEIEERIITKSASITSEVEKGKFQEAVSKTKNVISSSGAILLNENQNKYGVKNNEYYQADYQIKVETSKYDSVVAQLRDVGEIVSFNENSIDITGQYNDNKIELATEKERLERYNDMFADAESVSDKIELNDRIFDQERRIKYLEDSLKNLDQRVDYSSVYLTIREKQSDFANVIFVTFGQLVQSFVNSVNSLFKLFFVLIPWIVAIWIVTAVYRKLKK